MDIGFDQKTWRNSSTPQDGHPDWHALMARLGAAVAARRSFEEGATRQAGSFDAHGAQVIAQYAGCLTDVNPISSADPNGECGMDAGRAGTCPTGGRG